MKFDLNIPKEFVLQNPTLGRFYMTVEDSRFFLSFLKKNRSVVSVSKGDIIKIEDKLYLVPYREHDENDSLIAVDPRITALLSKFEQALVELINEDSLELETALDSLLLPTPNLGDEPYS